MGKPKSFQISLSPPRAVYNPGGTVDGHVYLELSEEMKMREIRIRFVGGAQVSWDEGGGNQHHHVSQKEHYFAFPSVLQGKAENQKDDFVLPPGTYKYPFRFHLPPICPSSFENKNGRVRYFAEANIDRPWRFNYTCMAIFTVLSPLDLNEVPDVMSPLHVKDTKSRGYLCCKAGPATAVIQLQKRGYVPGENIIFSAEINNEGKRELGLIYVELAMEVICRAGSRFITDTNYISRQTHRGLKPGETFHWNNKKYGIPPLPASHLVGCRLIDINYFVKIGGYLNSCFVDGICIPVEVIIGTIPLSNRMPGNMVTAANQASPKYKAYAFGKTREDEEGENENHTDDTVYTPKYIYYDFTQPNAVHN